MLELQRAAAQFKMDPHFILHACSTRFFKIGGSDLALALANKDRDFRVSSDQRPPTSPARTTNRARDVVPQIPGMFSPCGDVPPQHCAFFFFYGRNEDTPHTLLRTSHVPIPFRTQASPNRSAKSGVGPSVPLHAS